MKWSVDNGTDRLSLFTEWVRFRITSSPKISDPLNLPEKPTTEEPSVSAPPVGTASNETVLHPGALPEFCTTWKICQEGDRKRLRCFMSGCIFWHPNPAMLPPKDSPSVVQSRMKPGFFRSLDVSTDCTEENEIVTDLNLLESESAVSKPDEDVEMLNAIVSPEASDSHKEDVEMSESYDDGDMETETNSNLNQSRISDYFPSKA